MIKPVKISYPIVTLGKLAVRFHLKLFDQNSRVHNEFNFENKDYVRIDTKPFVTLEPISEEGVWAPGRTLIVSNRNIFALIKGLKEAKQVLYEKDVFATKNGELILYNDVAEQNRVVIRIPFTKQAVAIRAAVVRGSDDITYEGVILLINDDNNFAYLTIDELESLIYNISRIDFNVYSQMLLNYYIQYYGINVNNPLVDGATVFHKPKVVFDSQPKAEAVSNFTRSSSEDEFDNMLAGK